MTDLAKWFGPARNQLPCFSIAVFGFADLVAEPYIYVDPGTHLTQQNQDVRPGFGKQESYLVITSGGH